MELEDRNVTLDPDPYWPDRFEAERARVRAVSGDHLLGVFHVGSTAILDIPGKPALDVIAVYEDEASRNAAGEALVEDGDFERPAESTVVVRWADEYAVFIKLHTRDDETVRIQLMFREYLRDCPDARREYTRVKQEAAEAHPDDLEAYTAAKSEVVSSLLQEARNEGYEQQLPDVV